MKILFMKKWKILLILCLFGQQRVLMKSQTKRKNYFSHHTYYWRFWITVLRQYNGSDKYEDFYRGTYESDCQFPCKATRFHGKVLLFQHRKDENFSSLSFTLNQRVTVTESYIPAFSLTNFFTQLGGSLGLWLGVGTVQLLIIALQLAVKWGAKMRSNIKF